MAAGKKHTDSAHDAEESVGSRFSLNRLSAAFARLASSDSTKPSTAEVANTLDEVDSLTVEDHLAEVVSPRMIVEGMLFVGAADGRPLTNRQLAAHIRDISPAEVDQLVEELNNDYRSASTAYHIVSEGSGYKLQLRDEYVAVRRRFQGRVREVKLSPQAIEVLSIVAYRQPLTAEQVTKLRGSRSHSLLNQLVRRGLLCLERPPEAATKPNFYTTEKFNRLFGIESPDDLPSSADLDDA